MLVNVFHDSPWEHRRLQLAGVVLIATLAALVALSIAIYNKQFTNFTTVTVKAERAGLQLAKFGDVRLHGALVGRVSSIENDGKLAVITLSLSPDAARTIPDDVSVRILPTTLFGQNFLELVPPDPGTSAGPMRDGVVIPASRVETNVELQTILADLYPLLRSVRPADLNATLYALAHALQGKGDQLGDTLVSLEDYLSRMNTELPRLRKDLTLLSEVSRTYELAAPDLIKVLKNATVTARTVTQKKSDLARALSSLTGLARTSRVTLSENEQRLISADALGPTAAGAAGHLLARDPLPADRARPPDPELPGRLRGRHHPSDPRARRTAANRLHRGGRAGVRRGRPRAVVPRTAGRLREARALHQPGRRVREGRSGRWYPVSTPENRSPLAVAADLSVTTGSRFPGDPA